MLFLHVGVCVYVCLCDMKLFSWFTCNVYVMQSCLNCDVCCQVLALPPPLAGPPPPSVSSTHPGTRPPFISSGGVGNVPSMGVGRGVVNGGTNTVTNQPSISDIAAGALLIASVVQGQQSLFMSNVKYTSLF